jgi:hypothetical protein
MFDRLHAGENQSNFINNQLVSEKAEQRTFIEGWKDKGNDISKDPIRIIFSTFIRLTSYRLRFFSKTQTYCV